MVSPVARACHHPIPLVVILVLTDLFQLRVASPKKESYFPLHPVINADHSTICQTYPGLTKSQFDMCVKFPEVMISAIQGIEMSILECQFQFKKHRWNCSSIGNKKRNPHTSAMLARGYRESAFAYAVSSAGIVHAVSRACSMGKLSSCGCRTNSPADDVVWYWNGCKQSIEFATEFARIFLDSRENGRDLHSRIHRHNNRAGRLAVSQNTEIRCKCHGVSGSCEMKTCWRSTPDFRKVGKILKDRFQYARLVNQANGGRDDRLRLANPVVRSWPGETDLVYYEKSPNFCEADDSIDCPGTSGRLCNKTSFDVDNCSSLCCGRGYNLLRIKQTERCKCRFQWCCYVVCEECTEEVWVTVCK